MSAPETKQPAVGGWGCVFNDDRQVWQVIASDGRTLIDGIGEFRFADNKTRRAAAHRLAEQIRDQHNYATPRVECSALLIALRLAVAEKRDAKRKYDEWYDAGGSRRMETALECVLRTNLGHATSAVVRAAEVLADATNDKLSDRRP